MRLTKIKVAGKAISLSVAVLAFMLSAIDESKAPSEHSRSAQNCNDDGSHRAVIDSAPESCCDFSLNSCLLRKSKHAGAICRGQVQSMHCIEQSTQNLIFTISPLAFTGMNKHTYSACIESLEIPYRVMLFHLNTSTSIRAVDDLQSS